MKKNISKDITLEEFKSVFKYYQNLNTNTEKEKFDNHDRPLMILYLSIISGLNTSQIFKLQVKSFDIKAKLSKKDNSYTPNYILNLPKKGNREIEKKDISVQSMQKHNNDNYRQIIAPIGNKLKEYIDLNFQNQDEYIFGPIGNRKNTARGSVAPSSMVRIYKDIFKTAGIDKNVTFRLVQQSITNLLINLGVSEYDVYKFYRTITGSMFIQNILFETIFDVKIKENSIYGQLMEIAQSLEQKQLDELLNYAKFLNSQRNKV